MFISDDLIKDIKNKKIRSILENNKEYYFLGTVFPDIFFHNKKYEHISEEIHGKDGENTDDLILKFLKIAKSEKSQKDLAFVLGYISHCKVDSAIHPVIFYLTGNYYLDDSEKQRKNRFKHRHLETTLDIQLSKKDLLYKIKPKLLKKLKILESFKENQKVIIESYRKCRLNNILFRSHFAYMILSLLIKLGLYKNKEDLGFFYSGKRSDQDILNQRVNYKDLISGQNKKISAKELVIGVKHTLLHTFEKTFRYYNSEITEKELGDILKGESLNTGKINCLVCDIVHTIE